MEVGGAGELAVAVEHPPGTAALVALLFDSAHAFADLRDPLRTLRLPAAEAAAAHFTGLEPGRFSLAPALAVNWISAELARHEYGVGTADVRPDRPAWRPGAAFTLEPGLGLSAEWAGAWRLVVNGSVEFLGRELRRSPLTARDELLHVFAAVNYTL